MTGMLFCERAAQHVDPDTHVDCDADHHDQPSDTAWLDEIVTSARKRPDGHWAVEPYGQPIRGTVGRSRAEAIGKAVLLRRADRCHDS